MNYINNLNADSLQVSVLMITYNHENYITQAVEGVLTQETNFPFELVIANDTSIDYTNEVITDILKDHPQKKIVRYLNHKKNMGMMSNFIFGLEQCNAKYIAICEGDDYWIDKKKLQKQVDFLELNPDYSICHHAYKVFQDEDQVFLSAEPEIIPLHYDIELLSKKNTIGTLTVMFRNQLSLPEWYSKLNYGDYPLHLLNSRLGKIKYFPEEMAVYRRHKPSVTGSLHSIASPLFLIKSLEILYESLEVNQAVKNNLGQQLLEQYIAVFYHYHSLSDQLQTNFYFGKIRCLRSLFQVMDVNKEMLLQIYLYQIKNYTQAGKDKEIEIILGDFGNAELNYLLLQYANEVSLSNELKKSTSYRLGNKLVDPFIRMLRGIKKFTKK